jgi:hypothetical protein
LAESAIARQRLAQTGEWARKILDTGVEISVLSVRRKFEPALKWQLLHLPFPKKSTFPAVTSTF